MEAWALKLLATLLLLLLTLVFGLLPVWIIHRLEAWKLAHRECEWREKRLRADQCIAFLNCLAGGVFLGISLVHLYPEMLESAVDVLGPSRVPAGESLVACGFFLVLIMETLVMQLQHHGSDVPGSTPAQRETTPVSSRGKKTSYGAITPTDAVTGQDTDVTGADVTSDEENTSLYHKAVHHTMRTTEGGGEGAAVEELEGRCIHIIHPSHHHQHHDDARQLRSLRSFVLLLALSLHTLFEGLALGLQPSPAQLWTLFGAVLFHKIIIAFSLGLQFAENLPQKSRVILFMVCFSFMAPIGVAIGTIVMSVGGASRAADIVGLILQCLATGTFIYVTFFEVLHKEIGQSHNILKVLVVLLGFVLTVVLATFMPH